MTRLQGYRSGAIACGLALIVLAASVATKPAAAAPTWTNELLSLAATIPIQDGGRIKPLDTYARFKLLQINGRRSFTAPDGESGTALAWLLDCLFYPEQAKQYKVFLIESSEVMQAIGLPYEKPRDRFAYADLSNLRQHIFHLAQQYANIESKDRTPAQTQIVNLAHNIHDFETLISFFAFAGPSCSVTSEPVKALFGKSEGITFSDVAAKASEIVALSQTNPAPEVSSDLRTVIQQVSSVAGMTSSLALIPPGDDAANHTEWLTPPEVMELSFAPTFPLNQQTALLSALETLSRAKDDPAAFALALSTYHQAAVSLAESRGEYQRIPLEVSLYKGNYFANGKVLYIIAFLLASVLWLRPRNRILAWIAGLALVAPFVLHVIGITLRCIIRSRPPVTTLYETILFISATAVLVCIVIELMNRRRVALSLGAFMGAIGLFLADKYETVERTDTMPSLIAVLDTNFWLSTHVTTVTIGYSAGLLAGAVAHLYLLGKAFGIRRDDKDGYKGLARMTYGILCFGLLFSTLGTVLGGIWANDSWGRFWGWDPKENGALMIVLCELAILHLRMGGYIRDFGVAMASVFNAIVVGFSWFGVNLLGVGLHSYGFTSGVAKALFIFYCIEAVVLAIGTVAWLREKGVVQVAWRPKPASPAPAETHRR